MIYGFNGTVLNFSGRNTFLTESKALLKSIEKSLTALQFLLSNYFRDISMPKNNYMERNKLN